MADPSDKVPGQAQGRYYVDSQCIDCDLCRETAPANFVRNDEQGFSYVFKQVRHLFPFSFLIRSNERCCE
ncbi:MAG: ferredoxin [Acidobacteria bacterium]|nr:MAG: ferredoxin [Acidobacteriota bacterium]